MFAHLQECNCSLKPPDLNFPILEKQKVIFEEQFYFKDCSNINPLPFDFLIKINGKKALIEYHGTHHYEPVGFGNKNQNNITILNGVFWGTNSTTGYGYGIRSYNANNIKVVGTTFHSVGTSQGVVMLQNGADNSVVNNTFIGNTAI